MTTSNWRKADMAIGDKGKLVNKHNPESVLYGTVGSVLSQSDFSFCVDGNKATNAFYTHDWDFYQEQALPTTPGSVVVDRDSSVYYHLTPIGMWLSDHGDRFRPDHMTAPWVLVYDNKEYKR